MSIVLIHQNKETEKQDNETLQANFTDNGIKTVIVPSGLSVEWMIGPYQLAVINVDNDSKTLQAAAEKLKVDLKEHHIKAIILPSDTSIEVFAI